MKTLSDDTLGRVAVFLKAMAEPTRLRILRALHDGEKSVTEIMQATGASQSNVSKHLSLLVAARMVMARKEGTSTYYTIADPSVVAICSTVCRSIAERIRRERSTLLKDIERGVAR